MALAFGSGPLRFDFAASMVYSRTMNDYTATMSDAHAEWHRNAGVPMGQPGCPMDACHLPDYFCDVCGDQDPECRECRYVEIKCAVCKELHRGGRAWVLDEIRICGKPVLNG